MKIANIKSSRGFVVKNVKSLGIQAYDVGNDYPQKVEEIVRASGTGLACVRTYARFIYGHGFDNDVVCKVAANRRGETFDYVLKKVCQDYAMFHGFAVHINYNALFQISEVYHVPFEHCRFEARNKDTNEFKRIGVYDDWTGYDTDRRPVKKDDIDFIDIFNPDPKAIAEQVEAVGGWPHYAGQIYYFSGAGDREYPSPIFEAKLTNMRSEEGLDNVVARNVTCNFLPGVMIADINNDPESEGQLEQTRNDLKSYQGDENAGNIMLVQVRSKEEVPVKIDLQGENYDDAFTNTQAYLPDAIGRAFTQPPILRSENVTTGFATDEMVNAYKFYNTQTVDERQDVEMVFARIFSQWATGNDLLDATIAPLSYNVGASRAEQLGREATTDMIAVVADERLTSQQKVQLLTWLYGLSADDAVRFVDRRQSVDRNVALSENQIVAGFRSIFGAKK